jgi:SAM-dependent methyltransferase
MLSSCRAEAGRGEGVHEEGRRRVSLRTISTSNKGVFDLAPNQLMPQWIETLFVCPACRGEVDSRNDLYKCLGCDATYPVRYGIPDFRLWHDPYISVAAEVTKIDKLLAPPGLSFRELLERYYSLSPENPPELNAHYIAAMEGSVTRGEALIRKLRRVAPELGNRRFLDLGCGTAGLAIAATREFGEVAGADVALRWLVIGRQRVIEAGLDALRVPLVCANAEALPFRSSAFDAVIGDAVIEHVRDSARMRDESIRVLADNGAFFFTTNNRFSILPEPHVRILGFGLLPRRWMEKTALAVRKTPYKTRLHSRRELRRVFGTVGRVELPDYEPGELGPRNEGLRQMWDVIRRVPPIRWLLGPLVPQYFISGAKRVRQSAPAPRK